MKYDLIVIGSGPGGSITASLLAENGYNVILIDSGSNYRLNSCMPFTQEEMEQKYKNGGITIANGNPNISYVEGESIGGGSEINSGLYHRIPEKILKKWKNEFNLLNMDSSDLEPHYKAIENEISVSYLPTKAPIASLKLHEGSKKLGWESMEIPRWYKFNNEDSGGTKQSMSETYIPRFEECGGKILSQTKARKIIRDGSKWIISCESTNSSEKLTISTKNIFICAGSINTPALLRYSGIKKNIGNSLRMHPTVKVIAKFSEKVNYENMDVPVHQVKEFAPAYSFGCSISSKPYLALGMLDHPDHFSEVDCKWEYMAIYYAMIIPEGKGTIRNVPLFKDPLVRFHLEDDDMKLLAEALKKLSMLLFEAGAESLYPSIRGFARLRKKDEIDRIPVSLPRDKTNIMTIHLFSSCPMGENNRICATDSFGKVYGHHNLYINDGSLLCSPLGVNPQGAIMAIARRNIFHFLKNVE